MNLKVPISVSGPFDVVALGASAGGHSAISTVLRDLAADFPVPIVVMQHLGPESTNTVELYGRRLPFQVEWVRADSTLKPNTVLICPPRAFVTLLPDGTFVISPNERGAVDKPIDRFLESVARSFGQRAIGVLLTGMGSDGALGARQLHLAGGRVLVQSETSAEFPDMPKAAIQAGAADLVAPLADLGPVISELISGTSYPQPRSEIAAIRRIFGDEGQVAALAREIDWAETALGPVRAWPETLCGVVRLAIDSPNPVTLWLGEQAIQLINEAAIPTLGPWFLSDFAKPYPETAPERYELQRSTIAQVWAGERVIQKATLVPITRHEKLEDAWWDLSFTPMREADGQIIGVYSAWQERTADVLAARRSQTINSLASAEVADNRHEALKEALAVLKESADLPFAVAYLVEGVRTQALLVGAIGVEEGDTVAPRQVSIQSAPGVWPLKQVVDEGKTVVVADLAKQFRNNPTRSEPPPAESAILYPLRDSAEARVIGVLVLGTNSRLPLDQRYHEFLTLVGETIAAKVAESHARQRERERLERLAELDHAKTEFFANISHEFRTPLTLLLAPLEDLLRQRAALPVALGEEVEVATSNARRLLRLVNSLLDFSQIETRRQQAKLEPTDLCALTTDIASAFRSAIEAAGLRFHVKCDPNLQPAWVDREMWEKIVSNLLSNAFKFTFEGEITLELHALSLHAELVVRDTGIGIPEQEMPNLFKRFHRVYGARARTVEGSGIGLAIVDDLVKRLGGQLRARSRVNEGTEFTIWIPYKSARIQSEPQREGESPTQHEFAGQLAQEAARWMLNANELPTEVLDDLLGPPPSNGDAQQGTILVADDNADMRNYLRRLLGSRWQVELVANGDAALKAAMRIDPDVILADVMMPGLDGFQLIQQVRAKPQLQHTPVVLLTARTGEEAAIQGLLAGADEYMAKPFSPRELVARIQAVFERSRAQAVLRRSEERQTFLIKLGDAIQSLNDAVEIQETVARIAMDYYGADRCYYCEIESGNAIIRRDASRAGLPSVAGTYPLSNLPIFKAAAETGQPIVVADVHITDLVDEELRQLCVQLQVIAYINIPVMKNGQYVGNMCITQSTPRHWTDIEVELATETAQRTWSAVERAHAEQAVRKSEEALRESEERLRLATDAANMYAWEIDLATMKPRFSENAPKITGRAHTSSMDVNMLTVHPDDRNKVSQAFAEATASPDGGFDYEVRSFTDEGEMRWLRISGKVLRNTKGTAVKYVGICQNVTQEKEVEAALRANEERKEFLLKLSDALRPLADASAIRTAVTTLLREYFDVARSYYTEIDEEHDVAYIHAESARGDVPSVTGVYDLRKFAEAIAVIRSGTPLVIDDWHANAPQVDDGADELSKRQIRAQITVPLMKQGRLVGSLAVNDTRPRQWTELDIDLVFETAERTWSAIERARVEESLRASEEKFRTLANATPALVWVCKAPGGENIYFNDRWHEYTGQTREESAGYGWTAATHPVDWEKIAPIWQRCQKTGEIYAGEVRYRRHDGNYRWFTFRALPTRDDNGNIEAWYGTSIDIHDQKQAEELLRESEEKYSAVFNSIDEGFCVIELIYDEAGKVVDWRFLDTNRTFQQQTGLVAPVGKTVSELVGAVETYWSEAYARIIETGEPERIENYIAAMDRWYSIYASRVGDTNSRQIAVVFDDITERKRREENQAFLVEIGDELARLENITDAMQRLGENIGWHFDVKQCVFSEVIESETAVATDGWNAKDAPSLKGTYRIRDFLTDEQLAAHNAGEISIVSNTETDVRVNAETYGALGIRSFIMIPLVRSGHWRFLLSIIENKPREWRNDEIDLMRELTTRIWTRLERARAEAALRASEAQLALELEDMRQLQRISSRLIQEDNTDALYDQILEAARSLMHSDMASIQMRSPERGELFLLAQHGFAPESAKFWEWVRADDTTACGLVLRNGKPVIVPDVECWDLVAGTKDLEHFHLSGICAILSTPLISRDGRLVGVISTHWRAAHQPSERELRLLDVVARQAADLIERHAAQEALRQSEEKYRTLFNSLTKLTA